MTTKREDPVTRITTAAEKRERAKVLRALEKWLPLRKAKLALSPLLNGVADPAKDFEHGTYLATALRVRSTEEPGLEVETEEEPQADGAT